MADADAITPFDDLIPLASSVFAAAWSAKANSPTGDQPARFIAARGTGTIEIITAAGNTRSFSVVDGWERVVKFWTITTNTTVNVEVGF